MEVVGCAFAYTHPSNHRSVVRIYKHTIQIDMHLYIQAHVLLCPLQKAPLQS